MTTARVVIVHGLWMPGLETWLLQHRLRLAGFDPELYRYPTVTLTLTASIARFVAYLGRYADRPVHVVGYSLGGVLAVAAAQAGALAAGGRIVCLGAPLNGSVAGAALAGVRFFGAAVVGASIRELIERDGLDRLDGTHEVGCIAGSGGFGMGRMIAALEGPNDGTVTVEETRLDGLTEHIVLPVTHTTMLFDAEVARRTIAFLLSGTFEGDTTAR